MLNSETARFPKVTVRAAPALKTTVPAPAAQEADVEEFVHAPVMVQVSEPKATYEAADEMLTFPVTVPFPEVEVSAPPERVRLAVESVKVDLASVPPEIVSAAFTVRAAASVDVPALIVRLLKARVMLIVAFAVKVTVLVPAVNAAFAAVAVQFPPTLMAEPFACNVPRTPIVTDPAVIPRLPEDVVRIVFPVAPPAEF